MSLNNLYHTIQPFSYAAIVYLFAFLFLIFSKNKILSLIGKFLVCTGIIFHTIGFILRFLITGNIPVSNMYESIVFMSWALIICSIIFYLIMKKDFFLKLGAVTGALVIFSAYILPISSSMELLAPVLKSNYWLILHVMTIVISYGIFGFCMVLGHRHLFLSVSGQFSENSEKTSIYVIIHLLQAGLLTLGIGTVLGGVWANESWGRFWGWDPKETWAFITFLGYMSLLHFRYTGKLNNFWLAVGSIICFFLVLMTWYGVNFILGKGLHSYGFESGSILGFMYYLILEASFFIFIFVRSKQYGIR